MYKHWLRTTSGLFFQVYVLLTIAGKYQHVEKKKDSFSFDTQQRFLSKADNWNNHKISNICKEIFSTSVGRLSQ